MKRFAAGALAAMAYADEVRAMPNNAEERKVRLVKLWKGSAGFPWNVVDVTACQASKRAQVRLLCQCQQVLP